MVTETGDVGVRPALRTRTGRTRTRYRLAAIGGYLLVLTIWVLTFGVPSDTVQVFAWLWAATIAWNVEEPWRYHLGFLRDWWIPMAALVFYFYSRGLADELLQMPVHIRMPIEVDVWAFGELPSYWLQEHLCGSPCDVASEPRWYDLLFAVVYTSHFVVGMTLAMVLWLRNRVEWHRWMRRYVGMNLAGLAIYIAYPMAPPWMASEKGYLAHDVLRLTARGWDEIGLGRFHLVLTGVGNPVAAMPSLHAGIAFLVAFYGVGRLAATWRWLLLAYPLVMSFGLVYFGEHYVVDIVAGAALAGLVVAASRWWERSRGD